MRKRFLEGFHYDAHPMGILVSAIAALSTYYPDAKNIFDPEVRHKQIIRLIAKMPTLAAAAHRYSVGMPFVYPDNSHDFPSNFLSMVLKTPESRFDADPVLVRAMDALFILHADHEQNCSTAALRVVASSQVDPYSACAAACAALYGPLHGGANEAVIRMLTEIGCLENVPDFIRSVKEGHGRLQGFGHRVYKNYDPRAKIIRDIAYDVFEVTGKNPLLDIALGSRRSRSRTSTSFPASCTRTSTSIRASSTRPWDSRSRCSRCLFAVPRVCGMGGALGRDARAQHEDRPTEAALCRAPAPRLRADVRPGRPQERAGVPAWRSRREAAPVASPVWRRTARRRSACLRAGRAGARPRTWRRLRPPRR